MRSSSLAFAEQMRAVRLSTCALHMASSWGLLGSRRSLSIVYLLIFVSEAPDAAGVFSPISRPQPTERPRKALQKVGAPSLILFRGICNPSRSICTKKEASAMANTSIVRGTDTCTRPEGACRSVRAMPEHSTCRYGFVVTDEHRTNCNTRSPRSPRSNRGLPDGNRPEPARSF